MLGRIPPSSPTQAFKSDVQLLQCTIATGSARRRGDHVDFLGALRAGGFSSTTMEKMDVPAETLPVRSATLFVAAMPVPASPSGGHNGNAGAKDRLP